MQESCFGSGFFRLELLAGVVRWPHFAWQPRFGAVMDRREILMALPVFAGLSERDWEKVFRPGSPSANIRRLTLSFWKEGAGSSIRDPNGEGQGGAPLDGRQ